MQTYFHIEWDRTVINVKSLRTVTSVTVVELKLHFATFSADCDLFKSIKFLSFFLNFAKTFAKNYGIAQKNLLVYWSIIGR